jgi:multidrug resistance protein MdtO
MVLVFLGCLVGAWVSTGPERIAYAGVQVALAFLLTVLQGFGPSVSLDTAQGRIVGILLGNLVVYLIFTRIWPAPVEGQARALVARALSALAQMARLAPAHRVNAVGSAAAIEALAGKADEMLRLLPFEPRELRPTPRREAALHGAVDEIEALNRAIWLSPDANLEQTAARLDQLAERFHGPAEEGPACEPRPDPPPGPPPDPKPPGWPPQHAGGTSISDPFSGLLGQLQGAAR